MLLFCVVKREQHCNWVKFTQHGLINTFTRILSKILLNLESKTFAHHCWLKFTRILSKILLNLESKTFAHHCWVKFTQLTVLFPLLLNKGVKITQFMLGENLHRKWVNICIDKVQNVAQHRLKLSQQAYQFRLTQNVQNTMGYMKFIIRIFLLR